MHVQSHYTFHKQLQEVLVSPLFSKTTYVFTDAPVAECVVFMLSCSVTLCLIM